MSRTRWALVGVAVLFAAACGVVAVPGAKHPAAAARALAVDTARVQKGDLSAMVSQGGTLTYGARADGSPYAVINQARGVYTKLPESGAKVACGHVLYRVDDRPVVLLCGRVPIYRALRVGVRGRDVRQLNRNLHVHGAGEPSPRRRSRRSRCCSAGRASARPAGSRAKTRSSSPRRSESPR